MAKNLVLAKAQNAVLSHDWATAARLYKELLRGNESNVDYLKELGSIYVKAGEDEKAIPYYDQIITFYPHYIEAMNSLGAIYRRLKRYDESITILQRARDEGRNSTAVNYNLGFTYKEMGNYEDAIDAFESVISDNPDDVLAYNHLGSIYFAQKNYEKSIASFRRGLQVDPNHPILNYNLARCYEADKNYTDAIRYYETSLRTRPGWTDAIRDFSGLLIKCQDNKKAQDLVEKSIKLHPTDTDLLCLLGRIFINQFDYDSAAQTYKKADALKGNDVKILTCLSEALEKGDKVEQALEKVIAAIEIDPTNKDAKKQYIHSLLSAQRYDLAYENVTALNEETQEKDLQVLDLYAQYYICRGDEKNAKEYHSKIQKINHHYKDYMLNASDRYVQIGDLEKAEDYAKQFVERRGQLPDGYNRLGSIAVAKGDYKSAKTNFEKGTQLTRPNVLAAKGLAKVTEELAKNPDLMNYETPAIEVNAEEVEEKEAYIPSSFIGEVVGAESQTETEETAETEDFDYGQLGDNVPMGEALLEKEDDFWEDFDDDPNAEPQPLADEETAEEEEESPFGDDLLSSLAGSGAPDEASDELTDDSEDGFSFDDFEDAKQDDEIDDAAIFGDQPEVEAEPEVPVEEEINPLDMMPASAPEPEPEPAPVQPLMPDPYLAAQQAQSPYMQSAAMNTAGNAFDAAVMAQKMAMQITEQQRQFEKDLTEKNERMIKEAVDSAVGKAVEEKMQKSMDDQMERIMSAEEPAVPEDDFELPLEDEAVEVEVEPIESIMNPEETPEHDEMDDFLSTDDFVEEVPVEEVPVEEADEEVFADTDDFITEEVPVEEEIEAEVDEDDFADVGDFAAEDEPEEEVAEDFDFTDVNEFAEEETVEEDFADVADFASSDEPVVEDEPEEEVEEDFDFANVNDFAAEEEEADFAEEETGFAETDDFITEEPVVEPVQETPSLQDEIAKIEEKLSRPEVAELYSDQIDLFKTLRVLSNYLPDNQKDSFLSCRIRMIIEYIIAKMSGRPGLLITAESLLQSGVLGEEYISQLEKDTDEELSNDMILHVLGYMKSLAQDLEDEQLSKALCISADNIIEQIELENQKSQIF